MKELKNIKELAGLFLDQTDEKDVYSKHTKRAISIDVTNLVSYAENEGSDEFGMLTPEEMSRWKNVCVSFVVGGRYDSTKARRLFTARLFSDYLVKEGYLEYNPLKDSMHDLTGSMIPKIEDITIVKDADIKCMLEKAEEALSKPDPGNMLLLGVFLSGVKVGEVNSLNWDDVIIKPGPTVALKVNGRVAPLSYRVDSEAFIFAVNIGRTLRAEKMFDLSRSGVIARLRNLSDSCGSFDVRGSDFRWRYIVDLVNSGFDTQIIANVTGVTELYIERIMPILLEYADKEETISATIKNGQ
jgi:site-specific recombinase XerD